MLPPALRCFFVLFSCLSFLGPLSADDGIEFYQDIAPIFSKNCVACHNTNLREGGLNLETHETLLIGGDSGDSIVAGQLEESYLLSRVNGQEEPIMPPEDNSVGAKQLSEQELRLLESWIMGGAIAGEPMSNASIEWQDLPGNLQPIYAIATSDDGQLLAFGRGNQLLLTSQDAGDSQEIIALSDPELSDAGAVAKAHLDIVQSVAISPDSQRIASGGFRSVKIWKKGLAQQTLLAGVDAEVEQTLVSPTGEFLASVNPTIEIVNLNEGFAFRCLRASRSRMTAAVWMNRNQLVACDEGGQWYRFHAEQPTSLVASQGSTKSVRSLHRLGDDRLLAIDQDGQLLLGRVSQGDGFEIEFEPQAGIKQVDELQLAGQDSELIAVRHTDGQLSVFRSDTFEHVRTIDVGAPLDSFAIDHLGKRIVTVAEGAAKLWDLSQDSPIAEVRRDYVLGQEVRSAAGRLNRQKALIDNIVASIPALKKAAEKEREAQNKLQEATDKAAEELVARQKESQQAASELEKAEQQVSAAEAAVEAAKKRVEAAVAEREAKNKSLVSARQKEQAAKEEREKRLQALAAAKDGADRAANLIPKREQQAEHEKKRLESLRVEHEMLLSQSSFATTSDVAFSEDNSRFVVAGEDGILRIFSADAGLAEANHVVSSPLVSLLPVAASGIPSEYDASKTAETSIVALTSDGRLMLCSLKPEWQLELTIGDDQTSPFSDRVTALAFSPDGRTLGVGSGPPSRFGDLSLVSVADGSIQQKLAELHSDSILTMSFSPDGRQLATAGADKMCHLLDVELGSRLRSFEGHTHHVLGLDWRDDGQVLATAGADAALKLWKADTAEQLRTIANFPKEVTSLDFVGSTHHLVSSCADGTVRLYNADDGKQLRKFDGAHDALFGVAMSHQGSTVFAGGQAGQIFSWDLETGKLINILPNDTAPVSEP